MKGQQSPPEHPPPVKTQELIVDFSIPMTHFYIRLHLFVVAYDSRGLINVQSAHTILDIIPKTKQKQIVHCEMSRSETVQFIRAVNIL